MRAVLQAALVVAGLGLMSGLCSPVNAAHRDTATGSRQSLLVEGVERSYVARVPRDLVQRGGLAPLVLVLHGGGGNAANAEAMTGFSEKAEREGFIVAYPEGSGRFKGRLLTWNAGHCCGYAMERRVNDVAFIDALLDKLIEDYPVDPKRIYVTGMSNGGMMAHRLGIELSGRIAAIAPVVAAVFGDEAPPAHPVSALMINGMLDKAVPNAGGQPGGNFPDAWDGTAAKPVQEQAAFWARANSCANDPDEQDRGAFIRWEYLCPAGQAVELYLVKDNGHAWPGGQKRRRQGDQPSSSLSATDVIWDFFRTRAK
jgi:polyhydroxybutyrate depolymerase